MLDKVPGLVEVLRADGVVLDELHVVVLGDVALAVVADAVHNSDPEVLNGPQQVLTLTFYVYLLDMVLCHQSVYFDTQLQIPCIR